MEKLRNITEMPYYNTPASEASSEIEIRRILKKYGIENSRFTVTGDKRLLEFTYQPPGSPQSILVKIPIPEIKGRYKGRTTIVPIRQRLRMIVVFLKSLLEASHFGLYSLEEVFFGFVQGQLPDGKVVSMVELVDRYRDSTHLLGE